MVKGYLLEKVEIAVKKASAALQASQDLPPGGREIALAKASAALQAALEMLTDYKKL